MDSTTSRSTVILALLALVACGDRTRAGPPADEPVAAAPAPAPADDRTAPGGREAEGPEPRLPSPPDDHRPTGPEERALIAELYIAFAAEPAGFADKVLALEPARRRQAFGFMFCAAPRLLDAGQEGERHGAPIAMELPEVAEELIEYQGPRNRARRTMLRQLAGEFIVVGRCIEDLDAGSRSVVDGVLARQAENMAFARVTARDGWAADWNERIRRVFPALFAELLPEC